MDIFEFFYNCRRIRQGCLLSDLLFIISVDIMALRLRSNTDIKDIQVKLVTPNHTIKISQLANDITFFLSKNKDINIAMKKIESLCFIFWSCS